MTLTFVSPEWAPECRKGLKKTILKTYSPEEKERILSEFSKYNSAKKQNEQ